MSASTEAEFDDLITTLIVEAGCAGAPTGAVPDWTLMGAGLPAAVAAARDTLVAFIAQAVGVTPEPTAELLRLLDAYRDVCQRAWLSEYRTVSSESARAALLALLPALLADAEALAERERADEVRQARARRPVPARLVLDEHGSLWREHGDA